MDTTFNNIALNIIKEQALIIGPIAWGEAGKIPGLTVDALTKSASISGNPQEVIDRLVSRYEQFFGKASHEVCREAVQSIVADMQPELIPTSLR